jgi:hypothetical protein
MGAVIKTIAIGGAISIGYCLARSCEETPQQRPQRMSLLNEIETQSPQILERSIVNITPAPQQKQCTQTQDSQVQTIKISTGRKIMDFISFPIGYYNEFFWGVPNVYKHRRFNDPKYAKNLIRNKSQRQQLNIRINNPEEQIQYIEIEPRTPNQYHSNEADRMLTPQSESISTNRKSTNNQYQRETTKSYGIPYNSSRSRGNTRSRRGSSSHLGITPSHRSSGRLIFHYGSGGRSGISNNSNDKIFIYGSGGNHQIISRNSDLFVTSNIKPIMPRYYRRRRK